MPMRDRLSREMKDITLDDALREIRRHREQYPNVPPEVTAMALMRQVDSWDEHRAILKAVDEVWTEIFKAHESNE